MSHQPSTLTASAARPRLPQAVLSTRIAIDAAPAQVWPLLADPARHLDWNPELRHIQGRFVQGEAFTMTLGPAGKRGITFRPVVLSRQPDRELVWRGHLWLRGLFDGVHSLRLVPRSDGGTVFVNEERFSGLLVAMVDIERFRPAFDAANAGLKRLAEGQAP